MFEFLKYEYLLFYKKISSQKMQSPWRSTVKIEQWSHRLILIPQHQAIMDTCAFGDGLNKKPKYIAKQAVKWMLSAAKALAADPQIVKSIANLRFADQFAKTYQPNSEAISEIELKTVLHSAFADPIFAIVIDLKPTLGLSQKLLNQLVDEERFWNFRRLIVTHISTSVCQGEGVKYTLITYDPLADEESKDEMGVTRSIKPCLVKQVIESGEYTAGFYNTMHPRNTIDFEDDEENDLLRQYLTRLDHSLHL